MFTHNLCPNFDRSITWIRNPLTVLIVGCGIACVVGVFLHHNGFVLLAAMASVVALGLVWPWASLRGLDAQLQFATGRVVEGEEISATLLAKNRLPLAVWGIEIVGGSVAIECVPALGSTLVELIHVPKRRGVHPSPIWKLAVGFPFGIWTATKDIACDEPLLVWPKTFPVRSIMDPVGSQEHHGDFGSRRVGTSGDVLGLRPYRRGDPLRRVHWAQSARQDRLIVCEVEALERPTVEIVVDLHPGPDVTDWVVRVAASFANDWLAKGFMVALVWETGMCAPSAGMHHRQRLMDTFAKMPDRTESNLRDWWTPADEARIRVVVTTDRCFSEGWTPGTDQARWIVLEAAGFGGDKPLSPVPLPIVPWIHLTDFRDVSCQLLQTPTEVGRAM